jgi:hypothetical protein
MAKEHAARFLICMLVGLSAACEKTPHIIENHNDLGDLTNDRIESAPVFIVGQIAAYKEIGSPKPSRHDQRIAMQLCRISVRVENVLRGDIISTEVPVYYLVNVGSNGGPPRLGMVGRGGSWRIGDREVFLLRWDSGVLRTMRDTYPEGVEQVLTGPHPDYRPTAEETVAQMVIDILVSKGQDCSDEQMAAAVRRFRAYHYDLAYSVRKLRNLAGDKSPEVRKAAQEKLDELALSWPQIRTGWPASGKAGASP